MRKNKKSQTSIEFLILIGTVMFFFVLFFMAIQENMSSKIRERQNIMFKEVALSVQDEINLALKSSDGYERNFNVPQTIAGKSYEINLTEETVYIRSDDGKISTAFSIPSVSGDVSKGDNIIRKQGGIIYLNQTY